MKKRLLKAMPHVPILELRPELQKQNEATEDPYDPQDAVDETEVNIEGAGEGNTEANTPEVEANTTFHNLEVEHTGVNNGLVQRVKRFISKRKANRGNIVVGRTGVLKTEDDKMPYGDDESSESDNEEDQHDEIPLVPRNKRT